MLLYFIDKISLLLLYFFLDKIPLVQLYLPIQTSLRFTSQSVAHFWPYHLPERTTRFLALQNFEQQFFYFFYIVSINFQGTITIARLEFRERVTYVFLIASRLSAVLRCLPAYFPLTTKCFLALVQFSVHRHTPG